MWRGTGQRDLVAKGIMKIILDAKDGRGSLILEDRVIVEGVSAVSLKIWNMEVQVDAAELLDAIGKLIVKEKGNDNKEKSKEESH